MPTATFTPTRTSTPATTPAAEKLLITEVLYDGTQPDEGDEFVELYNPNARTIDLSGYKIGDEETRGGGEGMYQFPADTMIAPSEIIIVARNAAQFRARFPTVTNRVLELADLTKYTPWATGSLALSNSGDEILLLGPGDQLVDSVAWESGNFTVAGLRGDANASEPQSLSRYGTQDTNHMALDFLHGAPSPGSLVVPPTFPAPIPGASMPNGMFAYWGDLHAHSTASDGSGPPRMAYATARANGLHFFALTEHDAWLTVEEWDEIGNAARDATVEGTFIALRGFEYSNSTKGHINVLNTDTWVSRDDPNYNTLSEFYAWLAGQNQAIAQFNHPDATRGGDFDNLGYAATVADKIVLQEIGNNANGIYRRYETPFTTSLNHQWRVAPTNNSDHHDLAWGADSPHRIGALATALTQGSLLDAFRARRVFATEDANLALALQANGAWMGTTITTPPLIHFTVTVDDPNNETVQLFLYDNGTVVNLQSFTGTRITWNVAIAGNPSHYYFVRAAQADGDIAYTAPIWTDATPLPTPVPPPEIGREKRWDLGRVSIETARTTDLHRYVDLEACVTTPPSVMSDRYIYIQDGTAGIKVYLSSRRGDFPKINLGDRVSLRGKTETSGGEREVEIEDVETIQVRGNCGSVQPTRYATGAINVLAQGSLAEISGNVVSVTPPDELVLNDGSGNILVHIDSTTSIHLPSLTRGQTVRMIGIVSQWRGRVVIIPRYASDLVVTRATPTSTRTPIRPTATATRTVTPTSSFTPRATATRTPTVRAFMRPTSVPVAEPSIRIDAQAVAVAGATTSATASFAFFALALVLWQRWR